MRTRIFIPVALFSVFGLAACSSYRPMAHLVVYNNSDSGTPIDVSITHRTKGTVNQTIHTTLKPGLQELDPRHFSRGAYDVTAEANNGLVSVKKNMVLDTDRWVIITYTYHDSANIQKSYGYVDTAVLKKINGKYAGLDMYIENRKPPTL